MPGVWLARSYLRSDRFLGDFVFRVFNNRAAEGGTGTALSKTMDSAVTSFPYSFLLPSLSGRKVEPDREIPAKSPRAREKERISARMLASVSAEALRPTGPAAAEASPPILTLLLRMFAAEVGLMSNRTKSVAWPPSCNPKLAPSRAIIEGALQGPRKFLPLRQVSTPRP